MQRLHEIIPAELLDGVLRSYEIKKPTTFRVNRLKSTRADVESFLRNRNIHFYNVEWYEDAFVVSAEYTKMLTDSELYNAGRIYVQSLSSMAPPLVLEPDLEDKVLDLCAAPGSKTTQIASMMNNGGRIDAYDLSTVRFYKLAYNLKLQGVTNTKTIRGRGEDVWKRKRSFYDRALADVPCSLEGRFSTLDPKSYEGWSEKKVKDLAQRMRYLLWSAVQSTRRGGVVVYSTCTMSPEENEGVVDWVLQKEKGRLVIEKIGLYGLELRPGLKAWRGVNYDPSLENTARIFPNQLMEGFYMAKLKVIA